MAMTKDNVIPFRRPDCDGTGPWETYLAECSACGHNWQAVLPFGTLLLECPKCRKMEGEMAPPPVPATHVEMRCSCGCDLFKVMASSEVVCKDCGNIYDF
jgi:hypothetical protein